MNRFISWKGHSFTGLRKGHIDQYESPNKRRFWDKAFRTMSKNVWKGIYHEVLSMIFKKLTRHHQCENRKLSMTQTLYAYGKTCLDAYCHIFRPLYYALSWTLPPLILYNQWTEVFNVLERNQFVPVWTSYDRIHIHDRLMRDLNTYSVLSASYSIALTALVFYLSNSQNAK